mmetsp:Transcript_9518/g.24534  ORF Transcript_9518/g.24534 Transcript_9518/m.24534 type:complete len:212 (-) Transcript_9518:3090-3725(-)
MFAASCESSFRVPSGVSCGPIHATTSFESSQRCNCFWSRPSKNQRRTINFRCSYDVDGFAFAISDKTCSTYMRDRSRGAKKRRESFHLMTAEMQPFAFIRTGVSCISANDTAIWWYIGASNLYRASISFLMATASSGEATLSFSASGPYTGSKRAIATTTAFFRNLISTVPSASRTPPRATSSAYISIMLALMVGSTTTHAPPRSSANGGR